MREPTIPGWAEEQTPTPFLYHKLNLKRIINCRLWGVCRQYLNMTLLCCFQDVFNFFGDKHDAIESILFVFTVFYTMIKYWQYRKVRRSEVLSEYNIRYGKDRNIISVVKYLTNDKKGIKPTAYNIEMFLRFFEEIQVSINSKAVDKVSIYRLFSYYCLELFKEDNNDLLNMIEYKEDDWKLLEQFKKQMNDIKNNPNCYNDN